MIQKIVDYFEY